MSLPDGLRSTAQARDRAAGRRAHPLCPGLLPGLILRLGVITASALASLAQANPPVEPSPERARSEGPILGALGLSVRMSPEHPGAVQASTSLVPNFVLRWGRITVSNGGPLASRFGEPAESGLGADLLDADRLRVAVSLSQDQGRDSADIERLRGLHDIPSHLRGRLRVGWRLHHQWELMGVWRADLSGAGTGSSTDLTLLHDWRPTFIDHRHSRISVGATLELLDARRANVIHGVTQEDARRSPLPAYRLGAGPSEWRVFSNAQRDLGDGWVAYGGLGLAQLIGDARRSPIVVRSQGWSANLGVGRRF